MRYLFFDAVGTLFYPQPSAVEVYRQVGNGLGCSLSLDEITTRFEAAFRRQFSVREQGSGALGEDPFEASEEIDYQRWREVVFAVFAGTEIDRERAFELLWHHFALPSAWKLFEDVIPCWQQLRASNVPIRIGVASNFDRRIESLVDAFLSSQPADVVCYSTQLGRAKPSPEFYHRIKRRLTHQSDSQASFVMIGDSMDNDIRAAIDAGWQAVHLVRSKAGGPQASVLESNGVIRSLLELPSLLRT